MSQTLKEYVKANESLYWQSDAEAKQRLENLVARQAVEFAEEHIDADGSCYGTDLFYALAGALTGDSVYSRYVNKFDNDKRGICHEVTDFFFNLKKEMYDSVGIKPIFLNDERNAILFAYCGYYSTANARFVLGFGGKKKALRDYRENFFGTLPVWKKDIDDVELVEAWCLLYHLVEA